MSEGSFSRETTTRSFRKFLNHKLAILLPFFYLSLVFFGLENYAEEEENWNNFIIALLFARLFCSAFCTQMLSLLAVHSCPRVVRVHEQSENAKNKNWNEAKSVFRTPPFRFMCTVSTQKKEEGGREQKERVECAFFLLSGIFIKSKDCLWSLLVIEKWIKTFCKFKYQTTVIYWAIKKALRLIHQQSILKWDHNPFFAALSHSISIHTTIENSFYVLWMPAVSKHEARIPRTGQ